MSLLIGLLTAVLVLDALFLMLLVLVQLPKKEAGIGTAFGGGATDALFGAGSGNILTKLTKYVSGTFLGLSLLLSFLIVRQSGMEGRGIERALQQKAASTAAPAPLTPAPILAAPALAASNVLSLATNIVTTNTASTNAAAATNPAPVAPATTPQP
jgi:preprotein translocase subunit SecG